MPLTMEQIAVRYPRLLKRMRWVACLSQVEAISCLYMWRNLREEYAGEAVNHFGGTLAVIRSAIATRKFGIV